jgi:Zn-dependent protease with chaperone function
MADDARATTLTQDPGNPRVPSDLLARMTLLSTHPPMEQRIARLLRMARRPLRAA